jgi:hypothetical protein
MPSQYKLYKRTPGPPPPPPDVTPWLGWVGFASSRQGLSASDDHKRTMALSQVAAMATQGGVTAASLRAQMMWHSYKPAPPAWDASTEGHIQWAMSNGWGGIIMNQHVGQTNWAAWAAGNYDGLFASYLASIQRARPPGFRFLVIFDHEPNNNSPSNGGVPVPTQADAANWCKGQARFMKMTAELNDPLIVYSTCMVPNTAVTPLAWWNPAPALLALHGGDTTATSRVLAMTLAGLDPYPSVNANGTPQTLASRLTTPMTLMRSWGFTRFSFPEVGFYWPTNLANPTAFQQAKRLADELWTWCRANGVEEVAYFDNSPDAAGGGEGLILDTPQELLVYSRIARGITPTPIPA